MSKGDIQVDQKPFNSSADNNNRNRNISSDGNKSWFIKSDLAIEIFLNLVFALPIAIVMCIKFLIKKFKE